MRPPNIVILINLVLILLSGCNMNIKAPFDSSHEPGSFGYDLDFLNHYEEVILLSDEDSLAQVAVVPAYQGRIMTSTMKGLEGKSQGWINYDLISSKSYSPHIHAYGGEDRFWLGPEGGQYSIFFPPESTFTFDNWQTPGVIDTATYQITEQSARHVSFSRNVQLQNYSEAVFDFEIQRTIELLSTAQITNHLDINPGYQLDFVAFQSINKITNTGNTAWNKDQGLLSIWILGMFPPSDQTTIAVPIRNTDTASEYVNDSYFGKVPSDRLILTDSVLYFKGDGKYRSKIGIRPEIALPFMGSYDSNNQILTIIQYPVEPDGMYVNSLWELQDHPYDGDVANAYNDGPLEEVGEQLGPFY